MQRLKWNCLTVAYSEPCQTFKIEFFAKIVKAVNYFHEKLSLRRLTGFRIHHWCKYLSKIHNKHNKNTTKKSMSVLLIWFVQCGMAVLLIEN